MTINKQPRAVSVLLPETDTLPHDVQDGIEKRLVLEADSISSDAPDERRKKLIPWSNLIRCLEVVGTGGAIEQHLVQSVDLQETDACRNEEAILGCGLDNAGDESGVIRLPQEALSELLDLNIDVQRTLGDPVFLEQSRTKGTVLKFELPPHMKAVPPRNLVASNSTGTSAKVIEFRRPESLSGA
jgi:hypothetical protein